MCHRIIRSGEVRINKGRCQRRYPRGSRATWCACRRCAWSEKAAECRCRSGARISDPVWKTSAFIALDKPAGVAVHGGSGVSFGVIEQLRRARPAAKFLELVHRLDRGDLGHFAGGQEALGADQALQDQFRERATGARPTLALVLGNWPANSKR